MKKTILFIFIIVGFKSICLSQSFINGDFEINTSTDCEYNLTDVVFNKKVSNVIAFGKGFTTTNGYSGEIDIQTSGCYITPQSGNWCIGLASDTASTSDAVAIELNTNLIAGNDYELSFHIYGNTEFQDTLANIEVGETLTDTLFGILIDSVSPDADSWKQVSLVFTANQNSNYISVQVKHGIMQGWTQIDNFMINSITTSTNVYDSNSNRIVYPNPTSTNISINFQESISSGFATLISPSGRLLREIELKNRKDVNIDLIGIPSGVYFIKIESKEVTDIIKFIKR